jgi:hypothetical protein
LRVRYTSRVVSDVRTFLPGIGFRRAGARLAAPVAVQRGERTLTVLQLVATPEATDLIYEVTHLPGDASPAPPGGMDKVVLNDGSADHGIGGGMHISVRMGKLVRGFTMVPLPAGLRRVELRVSGPSIGEWSVPLELGPFPSDAAERYVSVDASDIRHGITVTVRGIVVSRDMTVLDLMVLADRPTVRVDGLGGLAGMRDASTALVLRDQSGRVYPEHFRQDARDQLPDPTGIADVAIFDALEDGADELVLEVPSICFDDQDPRLDVALPVDSPMSAMLGDYPIRVLASRQIEIARMGQRVRAVALDLGLATPESDVRVLKPWQVLADGRPSGYSYGDQGIHGPAPEPLDLIEIHLGGSEPLKQVTLVGATVQARGPWLIPFRRKAAAETLS